MNSRQMKKVNKKSEALLLKLKPSLYGPDIWGDSWDWDLDKYSPYETLCCEVDWETSEEYWTKPDADLSTPKKVFELARLLIEKNAA